MGIAEHRPFIPVEEYLRGERDGEIRHEYIGGQVYAMSDASEAHNLISGNVFAAIRNHLRGGPCKAFINDMKVRLKIARDDIFYYPDLLVTCDPTDNHSFFKEKPKLIIEVLSPSTDRLDRREKFLSYQRIPTLEEYVLVDQLKRQVTFFRKEKEWDPEILEGQQTASFQSIGLSLPLDEVYEDVTFE